MQNQTQGLKRGLSARHIRFMALGSAIGTGLFYGSAAAIQMAGPAVLLASRCLNALLPAHALPSL